MIGKIKFRGKSVESCDWVYGYLIETFPDKNKEYTSYIIEKFMFLPASSMPTNNFIEVKPGTVGQCVQSLRDSNDNEIYDGDRLSFTVFDHNDNDTQHEGIVKFSGSMWEIWFSQEEPNYGSDGPFDLFWVAYQDDDLEIIGNIHDKDK